jgi:outer membrane receptor protein involved in Fe transport
MKYFNKIALLLACCLCSFSLMAQTTVKGKVTDGKEAVIGANITIKGTTEGTITDVDGKFELTTNQPVPLTLVVTMVGMATSELQVEGSKDDIVVTLSEQTSLLNDVVVAASRVEEKLLESPVTIEKMDQRAIKAASSSDYYDDLGKLKGVQTINGSMTFTSINTRGFGGISNTRFVQLMDGMDNAAPLLNFPTGNIVGIGELDIANMELLPGASSALYGPNAFNGILLMNSKNPFDYPGFSAQVKGGFSQAGRGYGVKAMGSAGLRIAHVFKKNNADYVAIKANFSIFQGTDWYANDYNTDRNLGTTDNVNNPNFDGMNTYGDETRIFVPYGAKRSAYIASTSAGLQAMGFPQGTADAIATSKVDSVSSLLNFDLRRFGITEDQLLDNHKAQSVKGDFGVYYRPFKNKAYEFSYNYRIGYGNSVYQGSERYALRNFTQQFHKAEIKGQDFYIRAYMSQTHDGDSYNLSALGAYVYDTRTWAGGYIGYYNSQIVGLALQTSAANALAVFSDPATMQALRDSSKAAATRPWSSLTPDEQQAKIEEVRNGLFQRGGAGFIDNSRLFHEEAMLDLSRWTRKIIDIQVGGNHRMYSLSTMGTVFNEDPDGTGTYKRIKIQEYGAFLQLQRKFYKDMFKIQASIRWDKNQNFKSIFSPRVTAVVTMGSKRNHNIRASYQTGFRNPDSQAQYIFFPTSNVLLGGTKGNAERYGIYNGGSYTLDSYNAFVTSYLAGTPDFNLLKTAEFDFVKPENLQAWELGYKGVLANKFIVDVNGYFNIYKDFITQITVVSKAATTHQGVELPGLAEVLAGTAEQPTTWRPYVNIPGKTFSWGAGVGLGYMITKGFLVRGSYNYTDYKFHGTQTVGTARDLGFNTSRHQFYVGLQGNNVWKGLGFGVDYRWQSKIDWTSDFADGTVKARGVLDANISYLVEKAMTTIKVGATNIAGPDYRTNVGGPFIGRTFYVALTFDQSKMWKEHNSEVTGAKEF